MNKKQKKMLIRIIIAAVLIVVFSLLPTEGYLRFVLFMIPYLVIGYDILKKAFKGILNKQVFDENFLMGCSHSRMQFSLAIIPRVLQLCFSTRLENFSRAMQWERADETSVN